MSQAVLPRREIYVARRLAVSIALAMTGLLAISAPALAGEAPPLPTAANGATVERLGTGVSVPTSFAFAGDTIFAGSGPSEGRGNPPTGLFTLANGEATKVPNTPKYVFGLAYHDGRLFISTGDRILSYRGWNGTRFTGRRVVRRANSKITGFNGLAFGPDGRLYTGSALNPRFDHSRNPVQYANTVLSMTATGANLRVVARGLRQPFQLAFPEGATSPYVTDLGQDETRRIPLDQVVVAEQGANFGFPTCVRFTERSCGRFADPLVTLPRHASPMGIGSIGQTLYVALFSGLQREKPVVVSFPVAGGTPTPFLTGFVAPVVGLTTNAGYVYVGDLTGSVYRVKVS
jgi:glucose/arabinose dehydrogenase